MEFTDHISDAGHAQRS